MDLLLLTLLGGLLALDATSVGQFMFSRPLVAGTIAGWILGDIHQGLLVGGILELFLLPVFAVGGTRFPDGGPASVVAVATTVGGGGLAMGVLMGLLWGQVGAYSIDLHRALTGKLLVEPAGDEAAESRLEAVHLATIGIDLLRGAVLTGSGLVLGTTAAGQLGGQWPLDVVDTLGFLLVGAFVCLGVLFASFGGWKGRGGVWLGGLLAGLLGGYLL